MDLWSIEGLLVRSGLLAGQFELLKWFQRDMAVVAQLARAEVEVQRVLGRMAVEILAVVAG